MCDILIQQLSELVTKIESRHLNDPNVTDWIHGMIEIMLKNEKETIDFFNECSNDHARIIYWTSPLFDDIAYEFHSSEMAYAMLALIPKYPEDEGLQNDVEIAVDIINTIQNDPSLR
jgi:spore maturation protein CgeB